MAESDLISLKGSPRDHYDMVQKLYAELEQEREASATAASEALSMILRLQGEKAAEILEACQYKRMAEEKILHDEESLAIFEEEMYQKDMEIASLKFQVKIYRDTLSKAVTSDPTLIEIDGFEMPSLSGTDASTGDMSLHGTVRRNFTLPSVGYTNKCHEMDFINEEVFSLPNRRSNPKIFGQFIKNTNVQENAGELSDLIEESPHSDCKFCCDRVEDKHIKMKEVSNSRRVEENLKSDCILAHSEFQMSMPAGSLSWGLGNRPYTSCPRASNDPFYDSEVKVTGTLLGVEGISSGHSSQSEYMESLEGFGSHCCSYLQGELPINTVHSARFHDVYEVPQGAKNYSSQSQNKLFNDCLPEIKDVPSTTYLMPKEAREYCFKDEEWLKKALLDGQYVITSAPTEGIGLDYNCAHMNPKNGVIFPQDVEELWQSDVKQLKKQLQVLEDDRKIVKQEHSDRGEQHLKLLRDIYEHLRMIYDQIKRPVKKQCHEEDTLVVSVIEAMLSFSA
uniref:Protein FAM3C n=1 Tax=Anthurium amnicola TaxID=1678845 RepID=A0A1D1XY68_9ARAE